MRESDEKESQWLKNHRVVGQIRHPLQGDVALEVPIEAVDPTK
jgi:hypothetical protein